ncbi:MAG: PRC-barrel domain-containing protein [Proteobacteria bacterium]|nr:PRC-barrel domain-containing protein [Pseudomonadota bacterium]
MSKLPHSRKLIGSDRVEGTDVYGVDGDKIGSVKNLLIEKRGGQVKDVIVSVGGFLGIGSKLHSLPWSKFDYDTDLEGYRLNVTEDQLKDAPSYKENDQDRPYDTDYQSKVYTYWDEDPYWDGDRPAGRP